jgi:hypothetical protein
MTSHCTCGSMTTLYDFGGVLGRHLDTFFWAFAISWSLLLARVCEVALSYQLPSHLLPPCRLVSLARMPTNYP